MSDDCSGQQNWQDDEDCCCKNATVMKAVIDVSFGLREAKHLYLCARCALRHAEA